MSHFTEQLAGDCRPHYRVPQPIPQPIIYVPITRQTIQRKTTTKAKQLPTHIVKTLIDVSIAKKEDCPISISPITEENAAITSCFHIFDRESIERWLSTNDECPTCRAKDCQIVNEKSKPKEECPIIPLLSHHQSLSPQQTLPQSQPPQPSHHTRQSQLFPFLNNWFNPL